MNRPEHLLICLAEECSEVSQRVSKALRFGLSEVQPGQELNNAQRIELEANDLISVLEILEDEGVIRLRGSEEVRERKKAKLAKFMDYAKECGSLEQDSKPGSAK